MEDERVPKTGDGIIIITEISWPAGQPLGPNIALAMSIPPDSLTVLAVSWQAKAVQLGVFAVLPFNYIYVVRSLTTSGAEGVAQQSAS